VGSRWISYVSRDMAEGVLDEVRSDIRRAIDPLAAISPYVRNSPIYEFSRFWGEWVELQRAKAQRGEISHERARVVGGHEGRGYLEPIWHESVFVLDYGCMEALHAHLFAIERKDGRKLSPKSVHHVLADVRTCLKWLSRRRGFPTAPDVPRTPVPRHIPQIPTLDEQRALLDAIPLESRGLFLARGLLGVRDEEAARADLSDYRRGADETADTWHIRAKGGRDRLLPVPVELARWVRQAHGEGRLSVAGIPLFPNPHAHPTRNPDARWSPAARRRVMLTAMKSIGRERAWVPNEALRHCFGTRKAEQLLISGHSAGDVIRMIMEVMGHTSAESSRRYVQLAVEALREITQ
jgi:integrase